MSVPPILAGTHTASQDFLADAWFDRYLVSHPSGTQLSNPILELLLPQKNNLPVGFINLKINPMKMKIFHSNGNRACRQGILIMGLIFCLSVLLPGCQTAGCIALKMMSWIYSGRSAQSAHLFIFIPDF